ncbi:MAG: hypothetical protein K0S65_1577, partial [Labilithrix sp.]|nr:hypothetical protein [Labilithrix sp.]
PDGFYLTGEVTRVKTVLFVKVDIFRAKSFVRRLPPVRSRQAMVSLDADKRIELTMLRDVGADKMVEGYRGAFGRCGYGNEQKKTQMYGVFKSELKKGARVVLAYSADTKATTVSIAGGPSATIAGEDFMHALWCSWFDRVPEDQRDLGDALVAHLR